MDPIDVKLLAGILGRILLVTVGGFLGKHGYDQGQLAGDMQVVGGALLAVVAAVWSWYQKQPHRSVLKAIDAGATITATITTPPVPAIPGVTTISEADRLMFFNLLQKVATGQHVSADAPTPGPLSVSASSVRPLSPLTAPPVNPGPGPAPKENTVTTFAAPNGSIRLPTLLVAGLMLCLLQFACTAAPTVEQQYQGAAVTYQTSMQELVTLRQAGIINDKAYRAIEPARLLAWNLLLEMQKSAATGDQASVTQYLNAFNAALQQWAAQVQTAKVTAATQPAVQPSGP